MGFRESMGEVDRGGDEGGVVVAAEDGGEGRMAVVPAKGECDGGRVGPRPRGGGHWRRGME